MDACRRSKRTGQWSGQFRANRFPFPYKSPVYLFFGLIGSLLSDLVSKLFPRSNDRFRTNNERKNENNRDGKISRSPWIWEQRFLNGSIIFRDEREPTLPPKKNLPSPPLTCNIAHSLIGTRGNANETKSKENAKKPGTLPCVQPCGSIYVVTNSVLLFSFLFFSLFFATLRIRSTSTLIKPEQENIIVINIVRI